MFQPKRTQSTNKQAAANEGVKRDALGVANGALAACYISNDAVHDGPSKLSDWLRTHPTTYRRIERLQQLAAAKGEPFRVQF